MNLSAGVNQCGMSLPNKYKDMLTWASKPYMVQ